MRKRKKIRRVASRRCISRSFLSESDRNVRVQTQLAAFSSAMHLSETGQLAGFTDHCHRLRTILKGRGPESYAPGGRRSTRRVGPAASRPSAPGDSPAPRTGTEPRYSSTGQSAKNKTEQCQLFCKSRERFNEKKSIHTLHAVLLFREHVANVHVSILNLHSQTSQKHVKTNTF